MPLVGRSRHPITFIKVDCPIPTPHNRDKCAAFNRETDASQGMNLNVT